MPLPDPVSGRKAMTALLRFLAGGPCERAGEEAGLARLRRGDGHVRTVPAVLLDLALARGLVVRRKAALLLSDAGKAALKRLLAGGDGAFAAQHRDLVDRPDAEGGRVSVNISESPLAVLARLKRKDGSPWFAAELVEAGERLRADFTRGQLMPGLSMRFEPVASRGSAARRGGIAELTEAALAARLRVDAALDAVPGDLAGLLVDVCCFLKGLETVERERQWPQRSAKVMLHAGLAMLARHYQPHRPRRNPLRHWGGEDFRPDL